MYVFLLDVMSNSSLLLYDIAEYYITMW